MWVCGLTNTHDFSQGASRFFELAEIVGRHECQQKKRAEAHRVVWNPWFDLPDIFRRRGQGCGTILSCESAGGLVLQGVVQDGPAIRASSRRGRGKGRTPFSDRSSDQGILLPRPAGRGESWSDGASERVGLHSSPPRSSPRPEMSFFLRSETGGETSLPKAGCRSQEAMPKASRDWRGRFTPEFVMLPAF